MSGWGYDHFADGLIAQYEAWKVLHFCLLTPCNCDGRRAPRLATAKARGDCFCLRCISTDVPHESVSQAPRSSPSPALGPGLDAWVA